MKNKEIEQYKDAAYKKWQQHKGSNGRVSLLDDMTGHYAPSDQDYMNQEEVISVPCFSDRFSYWWEEALRYNEELIS